MIAATFAAATALAAEPLPLRQGLEPLAFLVGHCWQGELPRGGEIDTHCFEPVYGGQHVRDRHEVIGANGPYAGETFYSVEGPGAVTFTYFNSLGGVSRGTMRSEPGRLNFGNEEYRGANGQTVTLSVFWRPVGDDSYEVVTASADAPHMNGTVTYRRIAPPISVSETRAPDGTLMLIHEAVIDAAPAEVWQAISTPEGWQGWAVPHAWTPEGQPDVIETSYAPDATPGGPTTIRQRILAAVPGRTIAFRTIKAPEGFPYFELFSQTTGLFELEPEGEGRTRLRVIGAGYPDTPAGRELIGFFRDGNRVAIERLRQLFASGPVDWSRASSDHPQGN